MVQRPVSLSKGMRLKLATVTMRLRNPSCPIPHPLVFQSCVSYSEHEISEKVYQYKRITLSGLTRSNGSLFQSYVEHVAYVEQS